MTTEHEKAVRLVPDAVMMSTGTAFVVDQHKSQHYGCAYYRAWQPWANTEAGRSDALALSRAVDRTYHSIGRPEWLRKYIQRASDAWLSGTWQEWLDANLDAAVAIGEHMEQSNENS